MSKIYSIIIHLILLIYIKSGEEQCIIQNQKNFNMNSESVKVSVVDCLNASSNCCYAYIKYKIGSTMMENSYCSIVQGDIDTFARTLRTKYSDELKWYAEDTYNNYERFSEIGNNLNYKYYANYTCYIPPKIEEYSTYNDSICAKFDYNNKCEALNDYDNFDNFIKLLYDEVVFSKCNNYNYNEECISPFDSKYSNDQSLQPLLDVLIKSLNINNDTYIEDVTEEKKGWPIECQPIPDISIQIKCNENYSESQYITLNTYFLILFITYIL